MHQIAEYIKFLFQSVHLHGIHSPFVFQLEKNCLKDRTTYEEYAAMRQYRHVLLQKKEPIQITDLGAGSKGGNTNSRTIRDIARISSSTSKHSQLLFRLVRYLGAENILELGTNLGIGTQALALGNAEAHITSVEGCPNLFDFADSALKTQNLHNIRLIQSSFAKAIPQLLNTNWDLIFLDGHHQKEATLTYFNQLVDCVHNNSLVIIDDINWSQGMHAAWMEIQAHPEVSVSIDTFNWGLVFFRREQAKEHFKIRL